MILKLFWSFFKIGAFTFGGGYAMIPLIEKEVIDNRHWVERERFLELLTLAQSSPGPISLNTAVFVGFNLRGYAGSVAAVAGVVVPSFVVIMLIAIFFTGVQHHPVVEAVFKGMRPAVVSLIAAPLIGLSRGMGPYRIAMAVVVAGAIWKLDLSPIWFIVLGAAGGMLWVRYGRKGKTGTDKTRKI